MTEEVEQKVVIIDDKEYNIDDLSQKAIYSVSQLQYLKKEIEENQRQIDRLQMASNAFSAVLKEEIDEEEEDNNDEG